jgi:hypothetical protein
VYVSYQIQDRTDDDEMREVPDSAFAAVMALLVADR